MKKPKSQVSIFEQRRQNKFITGHKELDEYNENFYPPHVKDLADQYEGAPTSSAGRAELGKPQSPFK